MYSRCVPLRRVFSPPLNSQFLKKVSSAIHTEEIPPETPTIADPNVFQPSNPMKQARRTVDVKPPRPLRREVPGTPFLSGRSVRMLTPANRRCRMQFLYLADQHQTERGPNPVCERLLVVCPIGPHPREYSPIERDSCDTNLKEVRTFARIVRTREHRTSARNLSVSIPWFHSNIG